MPLGTALDPYLKLRLGAALALLQPGIDPVFLVLLSDHGGLKLADHGLIVGASQAGMATGALVAAFLPVLSRRMLVLAAATALLACVMTILVQGLPALLLVRALFGLANGMLYAGLLRAATARTPAHAMGTVLLYQLLIVTAGAVLFPQVSTLAGPMMGLLGFAAVPAASLLLLAGDSAETPLEAQTATTPKRLDPTAVSAFLFVAASMMIWSYIGAEGVDAGLSSEAVGRGVALGSLAAAGAALAVARGTLPLPVMAGALLAGAAMLTPFVAGAAEWSFIAAMVVFNIGSTYAVARFSALAIERRDSARSLVPALQSVAMVFGPLSAALAVGEGGYTLLALLSAGTLLAASISLLLDSAGRKASRCDLASGT